MTICGMGESGLVIRLVHAQCSVINEDGEQVFSKTGSIFLCIWIHIVCVVCKL